MQYRAERLKRLFFTLLSFRLLKQNLVSLFSSILILFGGILYAETEPNNACTEANPILSLGVYTGSGTGSSSQGDRDYFSFHVPADGTLKITIDNKTNRTLRYSELKNLPCPSSTPYSIGNNASTLIEIPSTTAEKYFIYLEGSQKNTANTYDISAEFIPNLPSEGSDLKVTKVANAEKVLIYNPFYYTVSVSNIGDQNVTDVNITDTLPDGMSADLDLTNTLTDQWTCMDADGQTAGRSTGVIRCMFSGTLDIGEVSIFNLHVYAPSTDGNITNTIEVSSTLPDIDPSNNTYTETTEITNEVGTAEHLCYTERTEILNPNYASECEIKGNFYYGNGCEAYVLVREYNATTVLSDIKVYKMYAPEIKGGSCNYTASTSGGASSGQCNDITNLTEYGSYTQGYAVDIDQNLVNTVEILLHDSSTYNQPRIDGIALFGDYMTEPGFHHTGRIYECNGTSEGGVIITSSADLVDTPIDGSNAAAYNASLADAEGSLKFIQTMVAGTPSREVTGVHLNLAGEAVPYETDTTIPYAIVPYMSNDQCTMTMGNIIDPSTGQQLVLDVPDEQISATGSMIVPTAVSRASRMQLIFVDPNSLSLEGQQCLANSSTIGNFARLAQCVNSEVQYKTAFGQDAWDRCGNSSGRPCLSQNNGSADPSDPTFDPATDSIYVNQLGCYMCTFNIQPACTTDNFAVRPDRMEIGITHSDAPDLLRAGQEYSVSLTARYPTDGIYSNGSAIPADTVVSGYTVNDHNYNSDLGSDVIRYFKDGSPDTEGLLIGTSEVNTSRTAFMVGGLSSLSTSGPVTTSGMPDETLGIHYTDVGTVEFNIYDREWAAIDNDDTPMDCNTSHAHTYICTHDQLTFIPHHFSVENIVLRNHRDGNFTYLSNDLNMSAHVEATIAARNSQGGITENFREGNLFYENPVTVDLNVTDWNASAQNRHPLDNTVDIKDINASELLGFGGDDEANGTHAITYASQRLLFNYQRNNNQPVNPFKVPESDINISVASTYEASGKTAIIIGSGVEKDDRNATFYFGRAKASQELYDVEGTVADTPITVQIYCSNSHLFQPANNDLFNGATLYCTSFLSDAILYLGQTDLNDWWLSLGHNEALGDGNIMLQDPVAVLGSGSGSVDNDVNIINGVDNTIQVTHQSGSLPITYDILLDTPTDSWLIYNAESPTLPPNPFYKVRFTGDSGWAGVGKTGHVLDINASTTETKRLKW